MKQVITNYTFNASTGAVTLTDFGASHPVDLKRLFLITDVTTNKILYTFSDPSVHAVISSNNVVTLSALQGGEANGDSLQIIYEVVAGDPTYEVPLLPTGAALDATLTGGTAKAQQAAPTTPWAGAQTTPITNTTAAAITGVTGGASISGKTLYLTSLTFSNTSGVTTLVTLQATSGGNTLWQGIVPAGGGIVVPLPTPIAMQATGVVPYFVPVTTGASITASASGYAV